MQRILAVLLAALGLAAFVWLFYDTAPAPAVETQPDRAPDLPESAASQSPGVIDPDSSRVPADLPTNATELPSSPNAPADPTEEELTRFARSVPPGTIEGIVLRGLTPVEGGSAWLGAAATGGLPWGTAAAWDADPSVIRTPIGADGVFRFADLPPDTYGVGVRAPDGATRHVWCELQADAPTQRIRIVLGTGGVRGRVYDEQGGARSGWQVAVYNWGNTLAGIQVIDGRETDAAGAFELSGLVGGSYVLSAGPIADRRDPQTRTLFFQLRAGEWKTVDVGSGNATLWTGRVLLPRGAPLKLAALTELRIEDEDARETAALSPEGSFQAQLAAGTYRVSLFAYSRVGGELVDLGEVDVPASGRDRDVVLPRALLRVRATHQGTQQDPRAAVQMLSTWLEGSGRKRSGLRGADGHEYFLALEPGEYWLSSSPPILGAPSGKLPVQIRATDDEVELDIVVGNP